MKNILFVLFASFLYLTGNTQIKIVPPQPIPDSIRQAVVRCKASATAKELATINTESKKLDSLISGNNYSEEQLNTIFTKSVNSLFPQLSQAKKDILRYILMNEVMNKSFVRLQAAASVEPSKTNNEQPDTTKKNDNTTNIDLSKGQNRLSEKVALAAQDEKKRYEMIKGLLTRWPSSRF